ncbi:MAG: glutathione S-transferase family protein [Propylenella sp.]
MSLTLYYHPLASFCWKVLVALYENDTPFEPVVVDLGDAASRSNFAAVWPLAKFPVLRDNARDSTVAEATIVIEYLDALYPGRTRFLPADPDLAWRTRMWDRVFDHYIHEPMQKIVTDCIRPAGKNDPHGVEEAVRLLRESYALVERHLGSNAWAMGEDFSLADCAASPALFYANTVVPFDATLTKLRAYLDRLTAQPSFARVLTEAEPYFPMFPMERKPEIRRRAAAAG